MTGDEFARRSQAAVNAITPVAEVAPVVPAARQPEEITSPAPGYIAPRDLTIETTKPVVVAPAPVEAPRPLVFEAAPAPPVTQTKPAVNGAGAPVATGTSAYVPDELHFTLPEAGNIFSRLFGSLNNISDIKFDPNPSQWLILRAFSQIGDAFAEFRENPRKFVRDLIKGEGANLRRRNALLAGSEMVTVGYMTIYLAIQAVMLLGKSKPMLFNVLCLTFVAYIVGCFAVRGLLLQRILGKFEKKVAAPKVGLEFATWVPIIGLLLFVWTSPRWFCQVFPARCYVETAQEEQYRLVAPSITTEKPKVEKVAEKVPKAMEGKGGFTGGSKPKPQQAQGGGGQQNNAPATKGVPPQMTQLPQIMPPTLRTPTVKNPPLVVPPTLVGDDKLSRAMPGRIGLPDGVDAPLPSLGDGSGTGLGSGKGGGRGPGEGGNMGGGRNQTGGGDGDGGSGGIQQATASLKPTILYKEKAKYTEAARQNRVQGTVLVSAIFTADGRVTNIRVLRGLPDGLNEEAIKAAQKIRFNPAVKNGQPVTVRMSMEFSFNLL